MSNKYLQLSIDYDGYYAPTSIQASITIPVELLKIMTGQDDKLAIDRVDLGEIEGKHSWVTTELEQKFVDAPRFEGDADYIVDSILSNIPEVYADYVDANEDLVIDGIIKYFDNKIKSEYWFDVHCEALQLLEQAYKHNTLTVTFTNIVDNDELTSALKVFAASHNVTIKL